VHNARLRSTSLKVWLGKLGCGLILMTWSDKMSAHAGPPEWLNACMQESILLLQPSLAASERVFSLLSNSFSNRQEQS
jgi:hypothetical protein